jgi:AraC-like DNA-binding protein
MAATLTRAVEVIRHASDLGCWESAVSLPHPRLRLYVREYVGGTESTVTPLCRREIPTEIAPVIFNFGPPFRIFDQSAPASFAEHRSFATGAFDTFVVVGSTGAYACVQVNFTILGARLFLGQPLAALANRVVPLEDALGPLARRLTAALAEAPDWAARFDLLDQEILARIDAAAAAPPAVAWAVEQLLSRRGRVRIGHLADAVGWSHRHFVRQFTEQIGLTPKVLARVLRFGAAADRLARTDGGHLADIAGACGYYDQAHFTRDFRAFAGVTPTELLASRLPERGGFLA